MYTPLGGFATALAVPCLLRFLAGSAIVGHSGTSHTPDDAAGYAAAGCAGSGNLLRFSTAV
jgi:hypothetical protein